MIGPTDRRDSGHVALRLARTAIGYELRMWRSLYRWVFRRPITSSPDAVPFRYAATVTPVMLAFIGVSAIEIPIAHMLLPWEAVRTAVDALGVYGLFWMIGLLASLRVHPHVVSDSGLRVRNGFTVDLTLGWDSIATVRTRTRATPTRRTVHFERSGSGHILHLGVLNQTNIDVVLREPTVVPLAKSGGQPITELRCYVDDPTALVRRVRHHLVPRRATPGPTPAQSSSGWSRPLPDPLE